MRSHTRVESLEALGQLVFLSSGGVDFLIADEASFAVRSPGPNDQRVTHE